jgi:hypothetical protein
MPHTASLGRDAALNRMRRANRWLITAAVAVTGVLTEVAAQAFPGRTVVRHASPAAVRTGRLPRAALRTRRPEATHHRAAHAALRPPSRPPRARVHRSAPASAAPAATAPADTTPAASAPAPAPAPAPAAPAPVVSGGS